MTTKTIEERVKKIVIDLITDCIDTNSHIITIQRTDEYLTKALTEQDCITRQEERERCAKKVEDWYCYTMCKYLKTHGGCDLLQYIKCGIPRKIRKTIEEEEGQP